MQRAACRSNPRMDVSINDFLPGPSESTRRRFVPSAPEHCDFSFLCCLVATMQPLKPHHSIASRATRFLEISLPSKLPNRVRDGSVLVRNIWPIPRPHQPAPKTKPPRGGQASSCSPRRKEQNSQSATFQLPLHLGPWTMFRQFEKWFQMDRRLYQETSVYL